MNRKKLEKLKRKGKNGRENEKKILAAHLLSGARETQVRIGMAYPGSAPVKQNKEKS